MLQILLQASLQDAGPKLLRFMLVGGVGFGLDLGLTWLLKNKTKVNKYIANSSGFVLGQSLNYTLNRIWTFQSHDPNIALQYGKFIGIALFGLLMVNALIYLMNDKGGIKFFTAKIIAMALFFVWNFTANYFFTF